MISRLLALLFLFAFALAPARTSLAVQAQDNAQGPRERYLALTQGWAQQAVFTPAERRAMEEGRKREEIMTNSLNDVLADQVLAKGEPSYKALAALYPGKI